MVLNHPPHALPATRLAVPAGWPVPSVAAACLAALLYLPFMPSSAPRGLGCFVACTRLDHRPGGVPSPTPHTTLLATHTAHSIAGYIWQPPMTGMFCTTTGGSGQLSSTFSPPPHLFWYMARTSSRIREIPKMKKKILAAVAFAQSIA